MRRHAMPVLLALYLTGCAGSQPTPIHEQKIVDLTWTIDEATIAWPTSPGFTLEEQFNGVTEGGFYYLSHMIHGPEHGGTHIDAPRHFYEERDTTEQIPLDRLIGPGITVDVRRACRHDRDYLVGIDDFKAWEKQHGPMPERAIVLLNTGFGEFWPDRETYMGTAELGPDAVPKLHFPGLDPEAADWLARRGVRAVGLDTPSIDHGPSTTFAAHVALFEHNIPAFENVAHLDKLPDRDFTVIALPAKIGGGSGGPLRIVALIP